MRLKNINTSQYVDVINPEDFDDAFISETSSVHAEMMSKNHLWIGVLGADESVITINITGKKLRVSVSADG